MVSETTTPPTLTVTSRAWIVYFVLLVVLGCTAMLAPVIYNWTLQLKPEQLAAERLRWAQTGPEDYNLDYRVKRDRDTRPDVYHVEVRGGLARRVVCNGQLLLVDDFATGMAIGATAGLFRGDDPARQTIEGIFKQLEFLLTRTRGRSAPARDYCVARFNAETGYPIHFIHRVAGTHQRQEWTIQITPVTLTR